MGRNPGYASSEPSAPVEAGDLPQLNGRIVIVSNRLPVAIAREDEVWGIQPAAGGLVTALAPLVKRHHGLWIGWPGSGPEAPLDSLLEEHSRQQEYDLVAVPLTEEQVEQYYRGFSNQAIWPLFHDLLGHCRFDSENWTAYVEVNRRFAEVIAAEISEDSFVWIHDYQLLLVGHFLRDMGINNHLNFFLHIPFPAPDMFRRLPWRQQLLLGLMEFDHIGFQTANDHRNYVQCVRSLLPEASIKGYRRQSVTTFNDRHVKAGYYPISIDFAEFSGAAQSKEVADEAWYLHENYPGRTLVLGLDRLDYTKGIPERVVAFERMLEKYPDTQEKVTLVQVVVPSRVDVPQYQALKQELDELAGRINSRYSRHGWTPIHYMYRHLDRTQLLAHYRACEIALVTPLRDGMNLVAKEYCAASVDNHGVLILSEFAGAAPQLAKGALMVNPYDIEGTADAIYAAYIMKPEERRRLMRTLRAEVRRNDVQKWIRWFLASESEEPAN